MFDVGEIISK